MANCKEGWLYICFLLLCQFIIFYMFPIWFMYFKKQCFTYMNLNRYFEVLIPYSRVSPWFIISFAFFFGHYSASDGMHKVTVDIFQQILLLRCSLVLYFIVLCVEFLKEFFEPLIMGAALNASYKIEALIPWIYVAYRSCILYLVLISEEISKTKCLSKHFWIINFKIKKSFYHF